MFILENSDNDILIDLLGCYSESNVKKLFKSKFGILCFQNSLSISSFFRCQQKFYNKDKTF